MFWVHFKAFKLHLLQGQSESLTDSLKVFKFKRLKYDVLTITQLSLHHPVHGNIQERRDRCFFYFPVRRIPPERVLPFGMKDNFWEMGT